MRTGRLKHDVQEAVRELETRFFKINLLQLNKLKFSFGGKPNSRTGSLQVWRASPVLGRRASGCFIIVSAPVICRLPFDRRYYARANFSDCPASCMDDAWHSLARSWSCWHPCAAAPNNTVPDTGSLFVFAGFPQIAHLPGQPSNPWSADSTLARASGCFATSEGIRSSRYRADIFGVSDFAGAWLGACCAGRHSRRCRHLSCHSARASREFHG